MPSARAAPKALPAVPAGAGNAATAAAMGAATSAGRRHRGASKSSETTERKTPKGTERTTTGQAHAYAGRKGRSSSDSDVFDGTTHRTSSAEHAGLAGAEAAAKVLRSSTPEEIRAGVEVLARAGAFGESSRKAAVTRGALNASAEGTSSGMAGVSTTAKGDVKVSKDLFNALAVAAEAAAKAGVEGDLAAKVQAGFGPLAVGMEGKLHAFAGAMGSVKASADIGLTHLKATIDAKVFAGMEGDVSAAAYARLGPAELRGDVGAQGVLGVEAHAKGTADIKLTKAELDGTIGASARAKAAAQASGTASLGGVEAKASVGVEAEAVASAEATGKLAIDLTGIEASGKLETFAGTTLVAKGATSFGFRGTPILAASGRVGVSAGVGGSVEGGFAFRRGKLKISGDLVAAFEFGEAAGLDLEIDGYQLAKMMYVLFREAYDRKTIAINRASPPVPRVPILDQTKAVKVRKAGYETYLRDLSAYDAKKAKQGESGIKRERVQQILDKRWHANTDNWQFVEFDEGVMQAAKDVFGAKLRHIDVQGGQLRAFDVKRTAEQTEAIAGGRRRKGLKF